MNRARTFVSVRFAATARNVFAGTRIFGDGATGEGETSFAARWVIP
jgi:hypothetical protein